MLRVQRQCRSKFLSFASNRSRVISLIAVGFLDGRRSSKGIPFVRGVLNVPRGEIVGIAGECSTGEGRSKFLCLFFRGTAPGSRVYNREMKDGGMSLLYHLRF